MRGWATIAAVAALISTLLPSAAAEFSASLPSRKLLLQRVAVFSDDLQKIHDPRYPQGQTGADKMFAPIGLFWTSHPVPHQAGATTTSALDMGTAFLVSPCYILTNYHVVFGTTKQKPDTEQSYSGTFWVGGRKSRAVPIKYGAFYNEEWRDWALLQLDSDGEHTCLGETPDIGWVRLAALPSNEAPGKLLSSAGYPADKKGASLWRQDRCHLFEQLSTKQDEGLWTTDCATRPRASGSPIFFVKEGTLTVVALMHGHLGTVTGDEILPNWDASRANLAVDMGKIIGSDPDVLKIIDRDIDRYQRVNGASGARSTKEQRPPINRPSGIPPLLYSDTLPSSP